MPASAGSRAPAAAPRRAQPALDPLGDLLAVTLEAHPEAVTDILAKHVDDGRGDCRACTIGGQRGHHTWPCTLHVAAARALARQAGAQ